MNHNRILKLPCLAALMMLAACANKPPAQSAPQPPQAVARSPPPAKITTSILPRSLHDFRVNIGDTVHFALNAYNVGGGDKALLQHQAAWLNRYPAVRVTIEGHCDERGTREYSLALGARRASAVKELLVGDGVSAGHIEPISYGKEHPICTQSDETCWAQKRRGMTTITNGAAS